MSDSLRCHGLQPTRFLLPWTLQARILEWVAMPSSRGSSQPRDWTQVSHIAGRFFTFEPQGKPIIKTDKYRAKHPVTRFWIKPLQEILLNFYTGHSPEGHKELDMIEWLFCRGFPCSSLSKKSACNAGDLGSIPRLGRSPGEGNGSPLQDSCLENPIDRGAWWATVHGIAKSQIWLSD